MVWPCRIRWLFFVILRVRGHCVLELFGRVCWASIELWVETSGCDSQFTGRQWPVASDVLQSFACECDSGPSSADKRGFPGLWQLVAASSTPHPRASVQVPDLLSPAQPSRIQAASRNPAVTTLSPAHHASRLSHPDLDPGSSCPISPDQKPRVPRRLSHQTCGAPSCSHRPSAPSFHPPYQRRHVAIPRIRLVCAVRGRGLFRK